MSPVLTCVVIAIAGYLLGSISTGLLVSKISNGPNLYKVGSGNTGATNVTRSMGLSQGLLTFVGDVLKAIAACLIGKWLFGQYGAMLGGLFAVIGHNWPVYHRFHGGKGASSTCGVALFCFPIPALISFALGILSVLITRFISVGSLMVAISYAILICVLHWGDWITVAWAVILALLLVIRHRENIQRLIAGTERKFTGKKEPAGK